MWGCVVVVRQREYSKQSRHAFMLGLAGAHATPWSRCAGLSSRPKHAGMDIPSQHQEVFSASGTLNASMTA